MTIIIIFQRGMPEIINLIILLLGVLLCLLALNNLFEWLTTKPWKRSKPPEETILDDNLQDPTGHSLHEDHQKSTEQTDLFIQQVLQVKSGC
ncbi:MAG: hypothetical protein QME52_09525 [Bacteroidota bacterium]|nr:hypothetical protein [Bacteroidota bacterium]